jgi:hypothetical protein
MLVDEILAVGDVGFQARCDTRLQEIREQGATVVLVTHNLQMLHRMTERALVLERGRVVEDGSVESALKVYHEVMQDEFRMAPQRTGRHSSTAVHATVTAAVVDDSGHSTSQVRAGDPIEIHVRAEFDRPVRGPYLSAGVEKSGFGWVNLAGSSPGAYHGEHGPDRPLEALIRFRTTNLLPGSIIVRVQVHAPDQVELAGAAEPLLIHVDSQGVGAGPIDMAPSFELMGSEVPVYAPGGGTKRARESSASANDG